MLNKFFKKEKAKVYLRSIAVAPRSDIKHHLEQWGGWADEDLDSSLRLALEDIFDLPYARDVETPADTDLGLDIVVPKFQSGDMWDLSLGGIGLPIMWRPKIEVGARLFSLKSGKTVYTTTVCVKTPWKEFFSRLFTWRALVRFNPLFDSSDMNKLLAKACLALILKLKKVL